MGPGLPDVYSKKGKNFEKIDHKSNVSYRKIISSEKTKKKKTISKKTSRSCTKKTPESKRVTEPSGEKSPTTAASARNKVKANPTK